MNHSQSKAVLRRLAFIGNIEGISYLILLFIAMPLKYFYQSPEAVRYVGMAHGVLFVLFCGALLQVWFIRRWPFSKVAWAFISSFIPFGTFVLDKRLRREAEEIAW